MMYESKVILIIGLLINSLTNTIPFIHSDEKMVINTLVLMTIILQIIINKKIKKY